MALEQLVVSLEDLLLAHATGTRQSNREYFDLRAGLLADVSIKQQVPAFLRTCRNLDQFWSYITKDRPHYAERREHIWTEFRPLHEFVEGVDFSPHRDDVADSIAFLDAEHVNSAWRKALDRCSSDPEGALTAARSLLESVLKIVLDDREIEYSNADNLPSLYKKARTTLNLSPDQHSEEVFRKILGGCVSVVEGLGTVRNALGDSHGKGKKAVRPAARHAELAVNLAGAMAQFIVATHTKTVD